MSLKKELSELNTIIKTLRLSLAKAPEGSLRISESHGSLQYYLILNKIKKYIPKRDMDIAKKLAQKNYSEKALCLAEQQKNAIEEFLTIYNPKVFTDLFESLPENVKPLVKPCILSDEEYASKWLKELPVSNLYNESSEYMTAKCEKVRSKSEVMIADRLNILGIPYKYEVPLKLKSNFNTITIHPDFTILNKSTRKVYILEHFGMMDNPQYAAKATAKINTYADNGYVQGKNLLYTFETSDHPLKMSTVNELIKQYFAGQ